MNLLFVTPRLPYPPHRGDKLKIYNLIRRLSKKHVISLICFIQRTDEKKHVKALKEFCENIRVILIPGYRSHLNCALNFSNSRPFQVAYFSSKRMRRVIGDMLRQRSFDLIHTHLIRMAQYTEDIQCPKILDLTDAVSLYMQRMSRVETNPAKKLFFYMEYKRLRNYEKILEKYDRCLLCSTKDKEFLQQSAPKAKISIMYNGIDLDYFRPLEEVQRDEKTIIYTGNMSYWPNIDGTLYFYSQILPVIRRKIPDVKVYVAGQSPSPKIEELTKDPQVTVTGRVEDLRPYYARATISVCPIRFKGGTLNKILESLAMGTPIVSTSLGIEGLNVVPGKHLLTADEASEFARQVLFLMKNKKLRETLAENGRKAVQKYSWDGVVAGLARVYEEVLTEREICAH